MTTATTLQLSTADGPMDLYEATPDEPATGAVLVVQEAFGVNDHIKDVTRRFADAGYLAVAPAFFHRSGGGTAGYEDFSKVQPLFEGLDDDGVLMDVDAALDHLHERGFAHRSVGCVGFCFGGRVAFLVAARRSLGACVTFYGGIASSARAQFPALIGEAAKLQTPWLGLFGDLDQGIPIDDVEAVRAAAAAASVDTEVVRYADAEHGFHCDARASYNPEAAADGWRRTLGWFSAHLTS